MKVGTRWAFIFDRDEFVRLSLNRILKKYGFEVEELDSLGQLEKRKNEIAAAMVLADVEIETLEKALPLLKEWNERFVLMTPTVTAESALYLKKIGIRRVIKKPVEPRLLRKVIREISFPGESNSAGVRREDSRLSQKGGEST
jgi:DNA-binding NtrC family response regulator